MTDKTRRTVLSVLVTAAVVLLLIIPDSGFAEVDLGVDFSYYESSSETAGEETSSSIFNQIYTLGIRKSLTDTISFWGDVRWTLTEIDGVETSKAYPIFSLSFSPPALYDLRFSYNRTESAPTEGERISASNLSAAFSMPRTRWPSFVLTFDRSTTEDHEEPKELNTVSRNLRANSSYGFNISEVSAVLDYMFSYSTSEDKVGGTKSSSPSHQASLSLSRSFFKGKVKSSANVGYELRDSTSESLTGVSRFEQAVSLAEGLASFDPADPGSTTLGSEPELIDQNTSTPVIPSIDLNDANWNIGFGFAAAESIFEIDLFIKTTEGIGSEEEAIINGVYDFDWELYTSADNFTWTSMGALTPVYNAFFNMFEFTFTETTAKYFKVVNNTGNGTDPIEVTEIAARGFVLAAPEQSFTSSSTREYGGFNVSFTPMERLSMGFSFNYDHTGRETEGETTADTTSIRYATNLLYIFIPRYLTFNTNYSFSESEPREGATSGGRGYSLSLASSPLDTLNGNLTYSHSESLSDSTVTSEGDSIGASVFMKFYRGIDLSLSTTSSSSENPAQDSKSESQGFRWTLKLVPWRSLTTLISGGSSTSESESRGVKTSASSESLGLTVSFSPTRAIHIGGAIDIEPQSSQSYSLSWMPTRKVNLSLRLSKSEDTTGTGASLNFYPFPMLNLSTGYNATEKENVTADKTEAFFARASLRF